MKKKLEKLQGFVAKEQHAGRIRLDSAFTINEKIAEVIADLSEITGKK